MHSLKSTSIHSQPVITGTVSSVSEAVDVNVFVKPVSRCFDDLKLELSSCIDNLSALITFHDQSESNMRTILNTIKYTLMLSDHYSAMFSVPTVHLQEVDIIKVIKNTLDITGPQLACTIDLTGASSTFLTCDQSLLMQIISILLININNIIRGNKLSISVKEKEFTKSKKVFVEFRYRNPVPLNTKKPSILVVDDDENIRTWIDDLLNDLGCDVVQASNGFEGLDILHSQYVNLIILDLKMDGMHGDEVLETIRRNRKHSNTPVLIFSAHDYVTSDGFKKTISRFDPVVTLQKSSNEIPLLETVRSLIARPYEAFSLESVFALDFEQSIMRDPILKVGFFAVRKILGLFGWKMSFKQRRNGNHHVILELTAELYEKDSSKSVILTPNDVNIEFLKGMIDHFRHEIKNKLLPLQPMIRKWLLRLMVKKKCRLTGC